MIGLRHLILAGFCAILLASCSAPTTAPISTILPAPTALPSAAPQIHHAPQLRFGLIGTLTDVNVWALFDSKGYSYNNYAVHYETWPRLYQLSIPAREFEPMAASDMPSPMQQEENFFTATVPLRADLKWTDGSAFTADDVAFTVNTALEFQLGFDWHDYYNPDYLDHAAAIDAHTVKFFFKKQPNIGVWQYGALQGPIVQKAYWSPKISASTALLPTGDSPAQIAALQSQIDNLQNSIVALNQKIASNSLSADELRQAQINLKKQQGDLASANNSLAKIQTGLENSVSAAQEALYAIAHDGEPTLGNWIPGGMQSNEWANKINPAHPFGAPNFDNVSYQLFASQDEAINAIKNDSIDEILAPELNISGVQGQIIVRQNPSNSMRYLAFNLSNPILADANFRQALACILGTPADTGTISSKSFILPGNDFWKNSNTKQTCGDNNANPQMNLEHAVQILKSAGYSWDVEPAWDNASSTETAGTGLHFSNNAFTSNITLLSPSKEYDEVRAREADYIEKRAAILGIQLTVKNIQPENINFSVFSSGQYDMAILGWRVSEYPGYLCDWFGDGNPFHYDGASLKSACEALNSTTDLNEAQKEVYQIQSVFAQDLPMIPLYSGITYDAYRNISYPFDLVSGGLSGVYGAPSLAIPASQ
jgi:ABC-type transport system substrate-binding protein